MTRRLALVAALVAATLAGCSRGPGVGGRAWCDAARRYSKLQTTPLGRFLGTALAGTVQPWRKTDLGELARHRSALVALQNAAPGVAADDAAELIRWIDQERYSAEHFETAVDGWDWPPIGAAHDAMVQLARLAVSDCGVRLFAPRTPYATFRAVVLAVSGIPTRLAALDVSVATDGTVPTRPNGGEYLTPGPFPPVVVRPGDVGYALRGPILTSSREHLPAFGGVVRNLADRDEVILVARVTAASARVREVRRSRLVRPPGPASVTMVTMGVPAVRLGVVGRGCLDAPESFATPRTYAVATGMLRIALYAAGDTSCSAPPVYGPAVEDLVPGDDVLAVAWADQPGDLVTARFGDGW